MLSPGWGEGGALRSQKLLQPEAAASKKVAETVLKEPYRGLYLRDTCGVAQTVKASAYNVGDPGREDPLEEEMATDSRALAWKIPQMEEPGRLQSVGSQRVRHD